MDSKDPARGPLDPEPDRISIYRSAEAGRVFPERAARLAEEVIFNIEGAIGAAEVAVRAGELPDAVVRELREIHTLVRQQALGMSPQGRLI